MSKAITDTELLAQGLVLGTREEAMQYYQAYKRYGTSQKHPVDAIFDMLQSRDTDVTDSDCQTKEKEPLETIGYYLQVSGIWQKTTKEFWDKTSENSLPKVRINLEYWDESMELLNSIMNTNEAIQEVEKYLEELDKEMIFIQPTFPEKSKSIKVK